ALRERFDAIKARSFDSDLSEFERTLNEIGVVAKRG
ncbi:MAG: competence protein TfoX, partial [Pseudomonadota bacterium]